MTGAFGLEMKTRSIVDHRKVITGLKDLNGERVKMELEKNTYLRTGLQKHSAGDRAGVKRKLKIIVKTNFRVNLSPSFRRRYRLCRIS